MFETNYIFEISTKNALDRYIKRVERIRNERVMMKRRCPALRVGMSRKRQRARRVGEWKRRRGGREGGGRER